MKKKLYRSRSNRVITGLAGGIGDFFKVDPTIIRAGLIILEFATAGLLIIGYLIVSIAVPLEPFPSAPQGRKKVKNTKQ